jgi:hypothetical protein
MPYALGSREGSDVDVRVRWRAEARYRKWQHASRFVNGLPPFARNLLWGLACTLFGATALSVYVLVLTLVRRSTWFEPYGVTTWTIIGTYYGAGVLAGLVLGILRPLTHTLVGTLIVAVLAASIVYGAIGFAMDGRIDLTRAVFLGTLVGAPLALWTRRRR